MKKLLTTLTLFATMLYAAVSFAAVDVNKATAADLDSIKGIGPSMSAKIIEARKAGNFKDWADFSNRVSGIKDKKSAALSDSGLTVNGATYSAVPTKAEAKAGLKTDAKPAAASATTPTATNKPATPSGK